MAMSSAAALVTKAHIRESLGSASGKATGHVGWVLELGAAKRSPRTDPSIRGLSRVLGRPRGPVFEQNPLLGLNRAKCGGAG